jgi:hypothetical protein
MRKSDQPASESAQKQQPRGAGGHRAILQSARRAVTDQVAHDQPEVEASRMNQQALEDIRVAAQIRAAHATGVVDARRTVRSARPVNASGAGRVRHEAAADWHTPGAGPAAPATNRGAHGPAAPLKTGDLRPPGRSSSDCRDSPCPR